MTNKGVHPLDLPLVVILATWVVRRYAKRMRRLAMLSVENHRDIVRGTFDSMYRDVEPRSIEGGNNLLAKVCYAFLLDYERKLQKELDTLDSLGVIQVGVIRKDN